jgi:hypothetical protein
LFGGGQKRLTVSLRNKNIGVWRVYLKARLRQKRAFPVLPVLELVIDLEKAFFKGKSLFFVCTAESEPVPLPRFKRANFEKLNHLSKLPGNSKKGRSPKGTNPENPCPKEYGAETEKRNE